jgi:hypothetical protein
LEIRLSSDMVADARTPISCRYREASRRTAFVSLFLRKRSIQPPEPCSPSLQFGHSIFHPPISGPPLRGACCAAARWAAGRSRGEAANPPARSERNKPARAGGTTPHNPQSPVTRLPKCRKLGGNPEKMPSLRLDEPAGGRYTSPFRQHTARWSSPVAREAHNLEVAGSNPARATFSKYRPNRIFCCLPAVGTAA